MSQQSLQADKRGYLLEQFRLFHIQSRESSAFPPHYHEFHKLVYLCAGQLRYLVEGREYALQPGDLLLIPAHAIHQPVIDPQRLYDRFVLWLQPQVYEELGLNACFTGCAESGCYLLPQDRYDHTAVAGLLRAMEVASRGEALGDGVLLDAYLRQMLVLLARAVQGRSAVFGGVSDPKIDEILLYIKDNLRQDLSIEELSSRFYLSRSRLMHRFKEVTGCSVHQYVLQKRLILASQLLIQGQTVAAAAENAGFSDYSAFLRCFRRAYHVPPGSYRSSQNLFTTEETL